MRAPRKTRAIRRKPLYAPAAGIGLAANVAPGLVPRPRSPLTISVLRRPAGKAHDRRNICRYFKGVQRSQRGWMGGEIGDGFLGQDTSTVWTRLRAEVIVPNSSLISQQVINWTLADRQRRIHLPWPSPVEPTPIKSSGSCFGSLQSTRPSSRTRPPTALPGDCNHRTRAGRSARCSHGEEEGASRRRAHQSATGRLKPARHGDARLCAELGIGGATAALRSALC